MSIRDRRIENEWKFLLSLEKENSEIIEVTGREQLRGGEWFYLLLKETEAIELSGPPGKILKEHEVKLHYAEFFPAVPIEAYLCRPVLHPNVHPENGFICLWDRFSPGDSVLQAIRQIQRVISWELFNADADHLMQPEALAGNKRGPLLYKPVHIPEEFRDPPPDDSFRRRLS